MKYSILSHASVLTIFTSMMFMSPLSYANDPNYIPPSENIKNFFSGTWEGTFQLGYAFPQSSAQIDNGFNWAVGLYHDFSKRMAVEFQYLSAGDFDSNSPIGQNASFKSTAFVASLIGYSKPSAADLQYFSRLGVAAYNVAFDNGAVVTDDVDSGTTFVLGFGAEKKVNPKTTISIELTYYHDLVQSGYVNTLNFGIRHALFDY